MIRSRVENIGFDLTMYETSGYRKGYHFKASADY